MALQVDYLEIGCGPYTMRATVPPATDENVAMRYNPGERPALRGRQVAR